MNEQAFGNDIITLTDDDGKNYQFEIVDAIETDDGRYLAMIPYFANPKETAYAGIKAFRTFLRSIGMPINFAELGAKAEDIPVLVEKFGVGDGKTGGYVALDKQAITDIYKLAVDAEI